MCKLTALPLAIAALLFATSLGSAAERAPAAGAQKTPKTKALEAGAKLIQGKAPLNAMNMYLNGFHFHATDMSHQMEATHYCSGLTEELIQCAIFDSNRKDARLMGVEYIVSERLFKQLPDEEKKLWHSHRYEVKSGSLVAPGIPTPVEHKMMEKIISTYGKTWHTWDPARDQLPLGIPALMMGFTGDGQLDPRILQERDHSIDVDSAALKKERANIPVPSAVPGADAWEKGSAPNLRVADEPVKGRQ